MEGSLKWVLRFTQQASKMLLFSGSGYVLTLKIEEQLRARLGAGYDYPAKARKKPGWRHTVTFPQLVSEMIASDLVEMYKRSRI